MQTLDGYVCNACIRNACIWVSCLYMCIRRENMWLNEPVHAGDWIYIKLQEPIILTAVDIITSRDYRAPGRFKIYGSNDGVKWSILHDQSQQTAVYKNELTNVQVNYKSRSPPLQFHYIGLVVGKLAVVDTLNSYVLQIAEIKLYGKRTAAACVQV